MCYNYLQNIITHHCGMTSSSRIKNIDFSSDFDCKTDVFRDVTHLIINQWSLGAQKATVVETVPTSRGAPASEARLC